MNQTDFNFDQPVKREHTGCEKWDQRQQKFGRADVIPLWVADMDFAAPPAVQEAIAERARHPVFGYALPSDSLYESVYAWYAKRHHWRIDPSRLILTPGVVPTLFASVQALTQPGDGVLVPTPVYPPFFGAVTQSQRRLLTSELRLTDNGYVLDFDDLEAKASQAKMLLLCSPHNPVGRVWRRDELQSLIDLALRHNLIIVSDDIHCDLAYPGEKHLPLAKLAPPELRLITAISPSKTFNIPGLNLSSAVFSHQADQQAVKAVFARSHTNPFNPFTLVAFEAAYREGAEWLDALRDYLAGNRQLVMDWISEQPLLHCVPPQATCLMWLDCRDLQLERTDLRDFFIQKAGLGLNEGHTFGAGGDGFMRLNIGTTRARLQQALEQLSQALS